MTGPTSGGSATRATAGGRIRTASGVVGAPEVRSQDIAWVRENLRRHLHAQRIRRRIWLLIGAFWGIVLFHLLVWLGA